MMTGAQWEAQQRAAQQAQKPPAPAQPRAWEVRYDMIERLGTATIDRGLDPMRARQAAAQRARIEAQARPLIAQRDALNRQLAQLDEEYRRW